MESVGVIIPCYNVESYIDECLKSVMQQSYPVNEILCVDNNSSDSTLHKLQVWAAIDNRIQVLLEPKPGASVARNTGLNAIASTWIQFLDADDLLKPQKWQHQMKLLAEHTGTIDFIAGASLKRKLNGDLAEQQPGVDLWRALFVTKLGNTCANLWNRKALLEVGGWNETLPSSQESDLMFRLLKNGADRVLLDDQPLTIVRERYEGQISKTNLLDNLLRYATLRLAIVDHIVTHDPEYWNQHSQFFVTNLVILAERLFDHKAYEMSRRVMQSLDHHVKYTDILNTLKIKRLKFRLLLS